MPAEAIHLSALDDSLSRADAAVRLASGFDDPELQALLRFGSVLIDFPYFDRFAVGVLRYMLKRPLATSPIGDELHQREPARLGRLLVQRSAALRSERATRRDGDRLLAVALGFLSHLAIDSRLHPLVNRLAIVRAVRLGDRPARQHNEVEKFQSILFHEERLGFDFMGSRRIVEYIAVDARALTNDSLVARAYRSAIAAIHGSVPDVSIMARWVRGYAQYTQLLGSWFGGRVMPQSVKDEVRAEVYESHPARFVDHYAEAVQRSSTYIAAGLALVESPSDEAAFHRAVPEGSIDDPPYATDRDRGLVALG